MPECNRQYFCPKNVIYSLHLLHKFRFATDYLLVLTMNPLGAIWSAVILFAIKVTKVRRHSKEEGKDQESIHSSTTPDPGHHMGIWQKHKKTSYQRVKRPGLPSRWSQGCKDRQDSMTKTTRNISNKKDSQKMYHLGTVSKKINGRLKLVWRYQPRGHKFHLSACNYKSRKDE